MRFPYAQGYTGVRARGRGPEAVVQQPDELVKLAEVKIPATIRMVIKFS